MTKLLHSAGLQNRKNGIFSIKHYKLPIIHLSLVVGLFSLLYFISLLSTYSTRGKQEEGILSASPTHPGEVAASWHWPHSGNPGRWWRPRWPQRPPACGSWSALPSSWSSGSARLGTGPCNPPGASSGALREKDTVGQCQQCLRNAVLSLAGGDVFGSMASAGNKCSHRKKKAKISAFKSLKITA